MRWTLVILCLLVSSSVRADYWTDQQNERLRQIEYLLNQYRKPEWFDGTTITVGTSATYVENGIAICRVPLDKFEREFQMVDKTIRAQARAQAVQKRYDEVAAYCRAMANASVPYLKAAADAAATKKADAATEAEWQRKREQFVRELGNDGRNFVFDWAPTLDRKKYPRTAQPSRRTPDRAAQATLAAACKKYEGIPEPAAPRGIIDSPKDMCRLAALGEELFKMGVRQDAQDLIELNARDLITTAEKFLDGSAKDLHERYQLMLFEQDKWLAIENPKFEKELSKIGETVPVTAWASGFIHNDEVRAGIDKDGTTRAFDQPAYHDGAAESFVKKAWANEIKGVKVRKIGSSYAKWNVFDEKTFVKSDAKYDYYRINKGKNRYMRGWALLEIPGRPYCQAREWVVFRVYSGPIQLDALSPYGTFVKCQ